MTVARRGGKNAKKRAVVAMAQKLAGFLHHVWVTGEAYMPRPANAGDDPKVCGGPRHTVAAVLPSPLISPPGLGHCGAELDQLGRWPHRIALQSCQSVQLPGWSDPNMYRGTDPASPPRVRMAVWREIRIRRRSPPVHGPSVSPPEAPDPS